MDFKEYQATSRIAVQPHDSAKELEMHWALGLGEEAGEALGVIKHRHYGGNFDIADLVAELGDTLWYLASMCEAFHIDLEDVAKYNVAKLHHRYPTGDFDGKRSGNRHQLDEEFRRLPEVQALITKLEHDYNSGCGSRKEDI